jgi:trehalose utilization protein
MLLPKSKKIQGKIPLLLEHSLEVCVSIKVTIWNEYVHEVTHQHVRDIYPEGIHGAIAKGIKPLGKFSIKSATLEQPQHGLTDKVLDNTDVLIWWGHLAHDRVDDAIVEKVQLRVLNGMGLIVLHSGHFSKIFKRLMGTFCSLKWREADEKERLWNLEPSHPIMQGIPEYFELEQEEMYGERFDIPTPDKLLMVSWFQGGEVFRSACTWERGHGRIFYFRPGHETHPTYYNEHVLRIIANACTWASRRVNLDVTQAPNAKSLEPVPNPGKEHV